MNSDAVGGGRPTPNGASLAAVLAAGIGAFALGLFVILNEAGIFAAPSLYAPTGGLSGRTTFALLAWLVAWGVLHARWRDREVSVGSVSTWTFVLIGLGVVLNLPPVWEVLP